MANRLKPTIRAYLHADDTDKRYVRLDEMAGKLEFNIDDVKALAVAAGASYRLSRLELIHKERFNEFMKHIYKVPGTNKQVQKKFVRIGEGSIIYGISKTHLMTLVNDAGALYKVGNTALINTEIFEAYLEKFREPTRPLPKHVWNKIESEMGQKMLI